MRRPRALAALVVALSALGAGAAAQESQEPNREGSVSREVRVGRVEIDAYVTAPNGDPIPDLAPADFRVEVDGRAVTVDAVDWVPAGSSEGELPAAAPASDASAAAPSADVGPRYPPGRVIVLFFQSDYTRIRLLGLVRMAHHAQRFLDSLLPTDRVAVLSYDSQLKLRQDFTSDRALLDRAIFQAIKSGPPAAADPASFPTLAARYDPVAARKAATPERGLAVAARALAAIPGAKTMIFFGYALRINRNPREDRDYLEALRQLAAARTSLFTLDVTDADFHTLEVELERVSELTGGTYQKTHIFPALALARVNRAISGRYVLVFVKPEGKAGFHHVEVALVGKKGRVNARTYYED